MEPIVVFHLASWAVIALLATSMFITWVVISVREERGPRRRTYRRKNRRAGYNVRVG